MIDYQLLFATVAGIGLLLFLILRFKIQAFLALLISSIAIGLIAGMAPSAIIDSVSSGMGNTLAFVATIVGLGALFGAILEHSGGARSIASSLLNRFGMERAPLAMVIAGFVVAIPVFLDVAFIILVPVIYALQRKSGKSLLRFAIPLLAGLAVTHAFVPPTPGPIAAADILGANLGWVILAGFVAGLPSALIAGLWFGGYISKRMMVEAPPEASDEEPSDLPNAALIFSIIALPIALIVTSTIVNTIPSTSDEVKSIIGFIGHPFVALIIANILAWYILGIMRGHSKETLAAISLKSLGPAGMIILLTGAGGVLKQVLIDTGVGTMIAESMEGFTSLPIIFAFVIAALVRALQRSATVAMITAAGLVAPMIQNSIEGGFELALIVCAIASGASMLSHVNDSGFWLVNRYLGLTERQTFRSWTVMTTLAGFIGFIITFAISLFV